MGTSTLKSTGGDYSSIATWESAKQGTLSEPEILECYEGTTIDGNWRSDGALDEGIEVVDWVTTSVNRVIVRAADGEAHGGNPLSGFRITKEASNAALVAFDSDITVEDISFHQLSNAGFINATVTNTPSLTVSRCYFRYTYINPRTLINFRNPSGQLIFRNTVFENNTGGRISDLRGGFGGNLIDNCTFINKGDSEIVVLLSTTTSDMRNCAIYGSGQCINGSATTQLTNATADLTGEITGLLTTDFVDYAGGDYNPSPTGALDDSGTDLSGTFTDDITGGTRNGWDIGAYALSTGTALTFSLSPDSGPLPAGLSVNPTTGNIEGTPIEIGTFPSIIVRGSSDGGGGAGVNLIVNGRFDTDLSGWIDASNGTGSVSWSALGGGTAFIQRTDVSNNGQLKQLVTVEVGKTYDFSAYRPDVGGAGSCAVWVGSTDGGQDYLSASTGLGGTWSTQFVATTTLVSIMFRGNANPSSGHIDNVVLQEAVS